MQSPAEGNSVSEQTRSQRDLFPSSQMAATVMAPRRVRHSRRGVAAAAKAEQKALTSGALPKMGEVEVIGDKPGSTVEDRNRPRLMCRRAKESHSLGKYRAQLDHSPCAPR
jgi:hypothetical protein